MHKSNYVSIEMGLIKIIEIYSICRGQDMKTRSKLMKWDLKLYDL